MDKFREDPEIALHLTCEDYLRSKAVQVLYSNAIPTSMGIIVISLALWLGLAKVVDPILLRGWALFMITVAVWRLWLNQRFTRSYTPEEGAQWCAYFTFNTFIAGLGWGVLCLFPLFMDLLVYQAAILLVMLGVMGAAVPCFSAHLPAFIASSLPAALALPIVIYTQLATAELLAVGSLIFELLIFKTSFTTSRNLEETYRLEHANQHLVQNLQSEVEVRTTVQEKLQYHQKNLEAIVDERTEQLASSNQNLLHEIRDREAAEAERERLRRELDQTHKMEALGQLTGGIAHDFNNILGIMLGYTELVQLEFGEELPAEADEYLQIVHKSGFRARDLVRQMLTFSRRGNEDAKAIGVVEQVEEQIMMLRSIIPSSIGITLTHEKDLAPILMDPSKFQQLFMNLCVNARDAMEGVGELTIHAGWAKDMDVECSACHRLLEGDWICLEVGDSGSGIPDHALEHLFEPFFTTKEVGKGTGMGLSVLHGIVRGHGGHILVETEVGVGTTFRILLPPVNGTVAVETIAGSILNLPHGQGQEILVVDDEPELAGFIKDLLGKHSYRATVATDSKQALALFEQDPGRFDLLITDQTMPRLTGVDLAKRLRAKAPDLPVILCTGYSEQVDAEDVRKLGMRFLCKPIDTYSLLKQVGELVIRNPRVPITRDAAILQGDAVTAPQLFLNEQVGVGSE